MMKTFAKIVFPLVIIAVPLSVLASSSTTNCPSYADYCVEYKKPKAEWFTSYLNSYDFSTDDTETFCQDKGAVHSHNVQVGSPGAFGSPVRATWDYANNTWKRVNVGPWDLRVTAITCAYF